MSASRTEEEKFAEIVKNLHKVVMREMAASKNNTDIGRTCARSILELKDAWIIDWVEDIDNRVAVYDALAYELRDTVNELNVVWTNILAQVNPKMSKLWKKKDTIEDLMEAMLLLNDKPRAKHVPMVLGDIACIFEKVVQTGQNSDRDAIYDDVASAVNDVNELVANVQGILGWAVGYREMSEEKREKILARTKWVALSEEITELADYYIGGDLDEGGLFLKYVNNIVKVCKKGLRATEDIAGMTVLVLGERPIAIPGATGSNTPPTPGVASISTVSSSQSGGRR